MSKHIKIIAEGEINHNGALNLGKDIVKAAHSCGADSVKFQCFSPSGFIAPGSSFYPVFEDVALDLNEFRILRDLAQHLGIEMFSTAADLEGLAMIVDLDLPVIKIGSTNLTHIRLLEAIAEVGKPVYLSTGASTFSEVSHALEVFNRKSIEVTLFHCTVQYPARPENLNLLAIKTLKSAFPSLDVGFSDHSIGSGAAILAVALGATLLEKHFTIDKTLPGPDHSFSADPQDMVDYITAVRTAENMLGSAEKVPCLAEEAIRLSGRRYVTAMNDLEKGSTLDETNMRCRRIEVSRVSDLNRLLDPSFEKKLLGARVRHAITSGHPLTLHDLDFA